MKLKYGRAKEIIKINKLDDIRRRYRELKSQERFDKYFKIKESQKDLEYTKLLRESIRVLE